MNNSYLTIAVFCLIIIASVIAYNMYLENKYRRQAKEQFGHADRDALLNSQTESVRDGKSFNQASPLIAPKKLRQADISAIMPSEKDETEAENTIHANTTPADLFDDQAENEKEEIVASSTQSTPEPEPTPIIKAQTEPTVDASPVQTHLFEEETPTHKTSKSRQKLLLNLDTLPKQELNWFDPRFDYLAYVSLREPQELHALPRFSNRHRFQIAGCTLDDLWQPAEPIPGVQYQGFIIGLQAVSRQGLADENELIEFGKQVQAFAEKVDGEIALTDIPDFLALARPLDEVCVRVDQTIAMHLVSRAGVTGEQLRLAIEKQNFELSLTGAFLLPNENGEPLFSITTLDNSAFTSASLATQDYRGFTMLFDIPHVPDGAQSFDQFMDIAVRFSTELGLDLVNDRLEELSTDWLKDVRRYVIARQAEMEQINIKPGSPTALRLFS